MKKTCRKCAPKANPRPLFNFVNISRNSFTNLTFWKRIIKKINFIFLSNRMSSVCHSHVPVCHPYVTLMYSYMFVCYSYVLRMSLVCTRMSFVCHSYVLVYHPYVTRMYSYVIRVSLVLVCGFTMNPYFLLPIPKRM